MLYGVTDEGFNRKRQDTILDDLNVEMRGIFGSNFDLEPSEPFGQVNGVTSGSYANLWEVGEQSYNNFNPQSATGNALSNLVLLNAIERQAARSSTVTLEVTADIGTVIPSGSLVRVQDSEDDFATLNTIVVDVSPIDIKAASVVAGAISGLANTITEIRTPIFGWDSVTNPVDAAVGDIEETDAELRRRRTASTAISAQSVLDAMYGRINSVDGVISTTVLENDTDVIDANGLQPHSFEVIVEGGDDDVLANTIWVTKPAGILPDGSEDVPINDSQGFEHIMRFSRPELIPIQVAVSITVGPDYPSNGETLIKQAIVDYANGDLVPNRGFSVSDDVVLSELYTPINTVDDLSVNSLNIGIFPGATGPNDVPISVRQRSTWNVAQITVVQVP